METKEIVVLFSSYGWTEIQWLWNSFHRVLARLPPLESEAE